MNEQDFYVDSDPFHWRLAIRVVPIHRVRRRVDRP